MDGGRDDNRAVTTEPGPAAPQPPAPPAAWPARVVALVVVIPARAVWEVLGAALDALDWLWERLVMRPLAALARLLLRYLLTPLGRALMVPLHALWRWLLKPVLVALAVAASFAGTYLLLVPLTWLWHRVLRPVGRVLLDVLRPVGRALAWAWHASGRVLAVLGRWASAPFRWVYRAVLTPVGHAARAAWRAVAVPVGRAVAEISAEVGRAFRRR